ncbi:MAG: aldehyde dehydrogenase, partial [Candidatus Eisenbacteria bacterium]
MSGTPRRAQRSDRAREHEVLSPVTGKVIERVPLRSADEIVRAISIPEPVALSRPEVLSFLERLQEGLARRRDRLVEVTMLETGFIRNDSEEIIDAAIEFLEDFELFVQEHVESPRAVRHSYGQESQREMRIAHRPFRCVAAMVPQNASFTLAITIIASALYAGSRIVVRPSLQCAVSAAILAEVIEESGPPTSAVRIVNSLADDFAGACYRAEDVDLIHYIGSNRHA